jgi:SAM-dependent methyltransferase
VAPDLPDREASRALAEWLAGPRARLLRRAQVGLRQRVLELGCGHGVVTAELCRRAPGMVVALDHRLAAARAGQGAGARGVTAEALQLPFPNGALDLVLCQNVLMWVGDLAAAVGEAARVLAPGGALVALEPDYGGMLEHPAEVALADLWRRVLAAAGADPLAGRKVPAACEAAGLQTWVELQGTPRPAGPEALALLEGLPMDEDDRARVAAAARALGASGGTWQAFVHVPYVLVTAVRPTP